MKSVLISIQPYWVFLIIAKKMILVKKHLLTVHIQTEKTMSVLKSFFLNVINTDER